MNDQRYEELRLAVLELLEAERGFSEMLREMGRGSERWGEEHSAVADRQFMAWRRVRALVGSGGE